MKKLLFVAVALVTSSFVSCGNKCDNASVSDSAVVDSDSVVVDSDSVVADSIVTDSAVVN